MALYSCGRSTLLAAHIPVYDFLAPSLINITRSTRSVRHLSTSAASNAQDASSNTPGSDAQSHPKRPSKPLTQAQRDFLTSALRVNQAGELAATLIYAAQTPPIVKAHPHLRPLMKHMYDQEAGHFDTFNSLLAKHRIRPTAMYPLWTVAASALGWGTALLGREAAMACTEAVETEIGDHYNGQLRYLLDMIEGMESRGEVIGEDLRELVGTIRRIRDEELEHLDHAVENDAKKAVPHELLTGVIRAGCKGAIWISEKV
ncbi:5-demethoxyubiquinone hydroxylase, mitochondrial [Venustampulla echinocandica]|uniref:5-demethoxyubiquinone hydroxylase, mitochondrial n=1 Tax=Venustampulla echinocandica TaxID=2656787 RepID=A0A370TPW7_9HELO|nr:5-demethoxyubiquinone hydroxylase, mitochondrial [Venustampulla echinocandica]RDL37577.1 5-demethoxyubiquinone hydroxylase, mitochondrial [Venustampulla echinocandica]